LTAFLTVKQIAFFRKFMQEAAAAATQNFNISVLCAPATFRKTVTAAALIGQPGREHPGAGNAFRVFALVNTPYSTGGVG
jgi:hypothetical protein